jgi:LPPG:FO 2-phospho-L-lactate transferase
MNGRVVALAGGVGGAKLAHGLSALLGDRLTVIVNTGDDFEHLGLHISPDLDTVMYTLGGIANPVAGWGIANESWNFLDQIVRLGGPGWFRLGDRDLATHVLRTQALGAGARLTDVTAALCARLGIRSHILPMTDSAVRTIVETVEGPLAFQDYFVGRQCDVTVLSFHFDGIGIARPSPETLAALADQELAAVVVCPSNPFVSVDPILALPGLRDRLVHSTSPVIGVSPIIGGAAVKGPAARMMRELCLEVSALSVAEKYVDILDGFVIDAIDSAMAPRIAALGIEVEVAQILMKTDADRRTLADICLSFAQRLRGDTL